MIASRSLLVGGAAILAGALACPAALAQDASIGSIERQLRALTSELARIRSQDAARRAQTARAEATAREAREEARRADERALALSGGQSFSGGRPGGLLSTAGNRNAPGVFRAQDLANNGLGPHAANTAGEQQASALGPYGAFRLGGVTITLGGYIEALGIVRTRNEVGDFSSNFNAAPFPQSPTYHEPEFRGSSRSSRFSLLIEGKPSAVVRVAGYFETDFGAAGISSNSNESNSYALRLRQAYATYDNSDWGFHVLGGQGWSMLTVDRVGITPRQEALPLVPDGNVHVGFWYTRQWQLRFVKDFDDHRLWAGLSFEEPETLFSVTTQNVAGVNNVGGVIGGQDNFANPGGSLLNSTANYANDIAPDIIGKLAADPSFGHYEVFGLARFISARDTFTAPAVNSGANRTVLAGGGGAAMLLPLIGRKLVFQAQGLVGQGIGRYGPGQLPDATINQNGTPIPIPEVQAFVGLVGHPDPTVDLYAYVGTEQEQKRSFNERSRGVSYAYGYGNGAFIDTGCETEGSPAACSGQTSGLIEGTLGGWWRFVHGPYGTLQVGPSWSYVRRTAFSGTSVATDGRSAVDSAVTPKTDENTILLSFRYLPFL